MASFISFRLGRKPSFLPQKVQDPQDPVHTEAAVAGKEGGIPGLAPHAVEVHGVWKPGRGLRLRVERGTEW